jgi:hypothetical protein
MAPKINDVGVSAKLIIYPAQLIMQAEGFYPLLVFAPVFGFRSPPPFTPKGPPLTGNSFCLQQQGPKLV